MLFFLFFGTLLLQVFGVSLSMVKIVGGIVLTRIGFELFAPSPSQALIPRAAANRTMAWMSRSFRWRCRSCSARAASRR